jgi:Flp pilus assembly protein TadG
MKQPILPTGSLPLGCCGPLFEEPERESRMKVEKVCRSCRKHRRGAAAVEFAVVAPVFFLMILGMIEIGRAIMVQQIITNASREGARMAVLPGSTVADVNTRVQEILQASTINGATVTILNAQGAETNPETAQYGDVINVTVSVPFSQVSWLPTSKYLAGKNLSASTIMRTERVQ